MRPGQYFWKLFLGNAALLGLVLGISVGLISREFDRFHERELTTHLRTLASALESAVADAFEAGRAAELNGLATQLASQEAGSVRVTFVAIDGTVLGDSQADPATMESHADRPEIIQALADGWGSSTRWSHTVSGTLKYVAVRVGQPDSSPGVVRVAMPMSSIGARTESAHRLMWTTAIIALLAAVALALGLARLWSGRIRRITAAAESLSQGNYAARVRVSGADEVAALARSVNRMSRQFSEHVEMIERQRRTLELLLGQLQEGVVVAGPTGRIVLINPTAIKLLGLTPAVAEQVSARDGLAVEACLRQEDLRRLLEPPQVPSVPESRPDRSERTIQELRTELPNGDGAVAVLARATDIVLPGTLGEDRTSPGGQGDVTGRLLVLTDITELTRIIQMKTDFVANASHELRTPLAAIRASLETLLHMDLAADPTVTQRFLGMVDRHGARLEEMVADLLDLSRVESTSSQFEAAALPLREVLDDLRERQAQSLAAKDLSWHCEITPGTLIVMANAQLLRLVLDNLVDNAIKFTDREGRIDVACQAANDRVSIAVRDTGCGIPPEEHQRVFERFYQVARARSGISGDYTEPRGTGLGLSIVRHATAAMQGTIDLQSAPGQGTRVTVTLPQAGYS